MLQRQRKPRGGDRDLSMLLLNTLLVLSPLLGLSFVDALGPGVLPPSVVFRAFGAYSADSNNTYPFASKSKSSSWGLIINLERIMASPMRGVVQNLYTKNGLNVLLRGTLQAVSFDATWSVGLHNVECWPNLHVVSTIFPRRFWSKSVPRLSISSVEAIPS